MPVDRDRRLEREPAHARQRGAGPTERLQLPTLRQANPRTLGKVWRQGSGVL
jgi:hypothetical protein